MNNNLEKLSDDDLFLGMKNANGDLDKYFNVFYERYNKGLFLQSFSILENREEAEDNVQETFGKVYKKINSYTPGEAKPSTWVYRISMNSAIDKIRKKYLEKTFSEFEDNFGFTSEDITIEEYFSMIDEVEESPEELTLREEKYGKLRGHLNNLKGRDGVDYKLFLNLRYFEGKSYEEISEDLNLPIGTVKASLFRAKELLERRLSKDKYFS